MEQRFRFLSDDRIQASITLVWRVLVVATVADLLTTYSSLAVGNDEDNVFVAWVIESWGFVGFGVVKLLALVAAYLVLEYLREWQPTIIFSVYGLYAFATGLAAVTNAIATVALLLYA